MKRLFKILALIVAISVVTGCTVKQETQFGDSRHGQLEQIQLILRDNAILSWEPDLSGNLSLDEIPMRADRTNEGEPVANDKANIAWRAEIAKPWTSLEGQKDLNDLCEFWFTDFQGLGRLDIFKKHRAKAETMGVKIETIDDIKMVEDNRNTINFPKSGKPVSLFTCKANTVLRLARPGLTYPQKSTISLVYYLENNEAKTIYSVQLGTAVDSNKPYIF